MTEADRVTQQHIAWLNQYVACMNEKNWLDMRDYIERQTDRLSRHLFAVGELAPEKDR